MKFIVFLLVLMLCFMGVPMINGGEMDLPEDSGDGQGSENGFTPWLSYNEVVPLRKATIVAHDVEELYDDYIYLAAVPTSVFNYKGKLYSSPLLFYEPPYDAQGNADKTMNSFQGLEYFMQDWITTAEPEELELINVPSNEVPEGNENLTTSFTGNDPYSMSAELALYHWEYSEEAVIAVVDEYPESGEIVNGQLTGTIPALPLKEEEFYGTKSVGIEPVYHNFTIEEGYVYINAHMEWGLPWTAGSEERGKDLDLQVYDWQLGQVAASENWNVVGAPGVRPFEDASSTIYDTGPWGVAVTYMPTEDLDDEEDEDKGDRIIENEGNENEVVEVGVNENEATEDEVSGNEVGEIGVNENEIDENEVNEDEVVEIGVNENEVSENEVNENGESLDGESENEANTHSNDIITPPPDAPWNSDADYEIYVTEYPGTTISIPERTFFMTRNAHFELTWEEGGELTLLVREPAGAEITRVTGTSPLLLDIDQLGEGDHSVTVARMGAGASEVSFELSYSWEASKHKGEGESFASAANGAVWASMKNCPLLYVKPDSIPSKVEDALNTLGVREIDVIDFGDRFEEDMKDIRNLLERNLKNVEHYTDAEKFYHKISDASKQNDIVITTMDPWTYWYSEEGPKGELDGARFVGPAAFSAAHHGAPVLIMELHPGLSNPQAWQNRFWLEAYSNRKPPSVGCMVLTGHEAYDYLGEIGLDREGKESIITVAGQFDIGTAWDRMLVGKANAGRILGTPVDTSVGICRSVFYPLMIFANPAVNPELDQHDGNRITGSTSVAPGPSHGSPVITDPGGEISVEYPNLYTWISQRHRFNERAGRDGYWGCDYTAASGITPYRTPSNNPIDKGNSKYRNDPDAMFWPDMTISEVVPFYGEKAGYDSVYSTSWDPVAENLNRGVIMWIEGAHGSNSDGGRIGFWDGSQQDSNPWRAYEDGGCTEEVEWLDQFGNPYAAGPDTVRSCKNTGADYQVGYDGLVTAILQQHHTTSTNGYQFDDAIENLHGVGISGSSCLISNTYLHISMIRHGSAFQVIDPWLTSWYSNFAIETFMRDIALGLTVGEAYANGIHHVGIEYLTGQWWWDIFENVVYFGDPDLRVYSPKFSWDMPETISVHGLNVDGHTPGGATEHPNKVEINYEFLLATGAGIIIAIVAVSWGARGKREGEEEEEFYGEEVPDPEAEKEKVEWEF